MQDQPIDVDVALADDDADRAVLALLLGAGSVWPWSLGELALELGAELLAIDAVVRLQAAGLVHRCHEFVWPTRSAARAQALSQAACGRLPESPGERRKPR